MNKYDDIERMIFLIKGKLESSLNEDEEQELQFWLQESENHRKIFRRVRNTTLWAEKLHFRQHQEMETDWEAICQRSGIISSRRIRYIRIARYAAVFIGLFLVTWLCFNLSVFQSEEPVLSSVIRDTIRPGSKQAYIKLVNGEKILLGNADRKLVKNIEGIVLEEAKEGMVILKKDSIQGMLSVEKSWIVVPRGGEYQLILSDGTKIWLNSDSKLEFPNAFVGGERRVRLFGEAYFEVVKNQTMPFRVELENMEVEVLGTSFNIYAYDETVKTTLVEGAVKLKVEDNFYPLSPGFEAKVIHGKVEIVESDVYEQIAWKEGKFVFREKRLEDVMSVLSRWYDFEIFYQNASVKDLHFTGNIPRHATINEVLKFLERTHLVHFSIVGRTVIVSA